MSVSSLERGHSQLDLDRSMSWFDGSSLADRSFNRRLCLTAPLAILVVCSLFVVSNSADLRAAPPDHPRVYHPLNQRTPPGVSAYWNTIHRTPTPGYYQPVRIQLPSTGKVRFFTGRGANDPALDAPSALGVAAGYTYRFQITNMPEFPGIELFPSVEILDHLHPPTGLAQRFPIPVRFLEDEIEAALRGRMITKVVYLEQPQRASSIDIRLPDAVATLPANENVLAAADQLGRPLLIIRLGSRQPSPHRSNAQFLGRNGPLHIPAKSKEGGAP